MVLPVNVGLLSPAAGGDQSTAAHPGTSLRTRWTDGVVSAYVHAVQYPALTCPHGVLPAAASQATSVRARDLTKPPAPVSAARCLVLTCICYAMPVSATRLLVLSVRCGRHQPRKVESDVQSYRSCPPSPYACAMRCPVLTYRTVLFPDACGIACLLSAYAMSYTDIPRVYVGAMRCPVLTYGALAYCPVLTSRMVLRMCYAKPATNKAHVTDYSMLFNHEEFRVPPPTPASYERPAIVLCLSYDMSGTDMEYGATRSRNCSETSGCTVRT
eukprot:1163169-Rhodomonas_salina.4